MRALGVMRSVAEEQERPCSLDS